MNIFKEMELAIIKLMQ